MDSRRRQLLIAAGSALAAPLARAQQSQKVRRIGFLSLGPITAGSRSWWQAGLLQAGYDEGKNIMVEWRSAEADPKRARALADELVRLKVELIVTVGGDAHVAAKHATQTIPIVMFGSVFPVELGLIKSLARPGGNITGTVWYADPEVVASKRYQLFRDALPKASRVASLFYGGDPLMRIWDLSLETRLAKSTGIDVQYFPLQRREELKPVLDAIALSRPDALSAVGLALLGIFNETAAFARQQKLVSQSDHSSYPGIGGLFSYGPSLANLREITFNYVDRILRGAKPGDLPIQQATRWPLVFNAKTAQAIGFKPPPAFMLQVTRQID